jgi:hypothetical protein
MEQRDNGQRTRQKNVPRLIFFKGDLALALGVCGRTVDRMRATGELPPPDLYLRGRQAWRASTVKTWVTAGCPRTSPLLKKPLDSDTEKGRPWEQCDGRSKP